MTTFLPTAPADLDAILAETDEQEQADATDLEQDEQAAPLTAQERVSKREAARITERGGFTVGQTVTHKRGGPVEQAVILRFSPSNDDRVTVYFTGSMSTRKVAQHNLRAI